MPTRVLVGLWLAKAVFTLVQCLSKIYKAITITACVNNLEIKNESNQDIEMPKREAICKCWTGLFRGCQPIFGVVSYVFCYDAMRRHHKLFWWLLVASLAAEPSFK